MNTPATQCDYGFDCNGDADDHGGFAPLYEDRELQEIVDDAGKDSPRRAAAAAELERRKQDSPA